MMIVDFGFLIWGRMQEVALLGAEEEEAAVDEAEELLEVVVESQGAIVEALAEGGVVRVGEEAAAEDEDGFGDAVAEAVADAEALGVAFGFPFFPDGFGGSGGGFAGPGGVEDAPEGGEVGVAVLVVAEDGFEVEFEEVRSSEGIGVAEEPEGSAVGDDGPEGIG